MLFEKLIAIILLRWGFLISIFNIRYHRRGMSNYCTKTVNIYELQRVFS